ncbi:MAG: radical SAM protein [Thermodesulfobacteriota bacterium]
MEYDIVLINATFSNSTFNRRLCFPLGILYLGAILMARGYKVTLLDYNLIPKDFNEIEKDIQQIKTPIFAITSLSSGYSFVKRITSIIRRNLPKSKIILGGAITFGVPEFILQNVGVDMLVEGEAESCIIDLVEAILGNKEINISGVYTFLNNEIKRQLYPQDLIMDISTLPFPAWSLLDVEQYIQKSLHAWHSDGMRTFPILASRGCPFNCNFCSKTLGSKVRVRKDDTIEEIEMAIKQYHINDVWFLDEEFALSEKRVMEMCQMMGSLSKRISFICSMRVDCVSPTILQSMKEAGCRRIVYGVESGSQTILDNMNKRITVAQASNAIIETRKWGIEAYVNFMFNYPGETESTLRETISFMKQHRLYSTFSFTTPLPGTELFDYAISNGKIINLDSYLESLQNRLTTELVLNLTDLPTKRLLELREIAKRELFPHRIILKD